MAPPPNNPYTLPLSPGLEPGERRLYLVNHKIGGINTFKGIDRSPDAIVTYSEYDTKPHPKGTKDWEVELVKMIGKPNAQRFTGVEIHSHGKPGQILLDPVVDMSNVEEFGGLLKRVVFPGVLIEVLACEVAAFPMDWLYDLNFKPKYVDRLDGFNWHDPWGRQHMENSDLKIKDWAQPLTDRIAENDAANARQDRLLADRALKERFLGADLEDIRALFSQARKARLFWNDMMIRPEKPANFVPPDVQWRRVFAVGDRIAGHWFKAEENGPRFCTELARHSGCIVRAAWTYQYQERTFGGQKNIIGDWERWVFDFDENGFRQAYFYLERVQAEESTWNRTAIRPVNGAEGAGFVAGRRFGAA